MKIANTEAEESQPPFDAEELLMRCVGRMDLVDRVLVNFTELLPAQLEQLEQTMRQGELEKARAIAHRLKGGALTISAHRLGKCAEQLEAAATAGSLPDFEAKFAEMQREYARLKTTVQTRSKKE